MPTTGLRAERTKAWRTKTVQDPQAKNTSIEEHMLEAGGRRDFTAEVLGTRLVGYNSYLRTVKGELVLATAVGTGAVIGWSTVDSHALEGVEHGLRMTRGQGRLVGSGTLFQSACEARDRSDEYQKRWSGNGVTQPVGVVRACRAYLCH